MSNRTIIEFNHDLAYRIEEDPAAFGKSVAEYLRSTSHNVANDLACFGAVTLATIHHTDRVNVSFARSP